MADDQDADLAGPGGPHALQVVAVRADPPADGATHGVQADDRDRLAAGDVHHGPGRRRGELGHGALGDGQALGGADDDVLGAAPKHPDHLAVQGLVHGGLQGQVGREAGDEPGVVAFGVDGAGEDLIRVFWAFGAGRDIRDGDGPGERGRICHPPRCCRRRSRTLGSASRPGSGRQKSHRFQRRPR